MNSIFKAFSDAAFADLDTRSSEGYLFKLFGGPVDWRAIRQDSVTTSATEAELLALSHAGTQAHWCQRFSSNLASIPDIISTCKRTAKWLQEFSPKLSLVFLQSLNMMIFISIGCGNAFRKDLWTLVGSVPEVFNLRPNLDREDTNYNIRSLYSVLRDHCTAAPRRTTLSFDRFSTLFG